MSRLDKIKNRFRYHRDDLDVVSYELDTAEVGYLLGIIETAIKMRKGLDISGAWKYGEDDADKIEWDLVKKFDTAIKRKS